LLDKHNPLHQSGGDISPSFFMIALLLFPQNSKRIPLIPLPYFKVNENFSPRIEKLT
jgi:hypothetical protein